MLSVYSDITVMCPPVPLQGKDEQIGYLGVAGQVSSVVAMLLIGRILDLTKSF